MVVIEGVARELEPEVNVWALAKPLVGKWVAEHLGPKARIEQAAHDLKSGLEQWMHLPGEIRKLLTEQNRQEKLRTQPTPVWQMLAGASLIAAGALLAGLGWSEPALNLQWAGAVSAVVIGLLLLTRR